MCNKHSSGLSVCSCQEASTLIEKAGVEERKLYISTIQKTSVEKKEKSMSEEGENPPPPPILLSRTDHSFTFAPAPYSLEEQVRFDLNNTVNLLC